MSIAFRSSIGLVATVLLCVSGDLSGQPTAPVSVVNFPVTVDNCGVVTTYTQAPRRVVTMNQAATELMLALGLQDHLVGTAFLDDAVLPAFAAAYDKVPVLAAGYPSQEELLDAKPDFVYAAFATAFNEDAVGPREDLAGLGAQSYLSPAGCRGRRRPDTVSIAMVYSELRDIGRIFGVSERAEQVIATYQADIQATQAKIGTINEPPTVFWFDSGSPPAAGACCGSPNEIIRLVGAENVFRDTPGSWTRVSWDDVVAKNPEAIVLVDSTWSPAMDKDAMLSLNKRFANIQAVKNHRFIRIAFSDTTPGVRLVTAVRKLAESLYPEKFQAADVDSKTRDLISFR